MISIIKSHHPRRHVKSFKHAFDGIFHALLNEANFRIQVFIAVIAVFLAFYFKIGTAEWGILLISLGGLLSAEMLNTVVEELMDFFVNEENAAVKVIKDLAAGFVLVNALSTFVILILIFGHRFG